MNSHVAFNLVHAEVEPAISLHRFELQPYPILFEFFQSRLDFFQYLSRCNDFCIDIRIDIEVRLSIVLDQPLKRLDDLKFADIFKPYAPSVFQRKLKRLKILIIILSILFPAPL